MKTYRYKDNNGNWVRSIYPKPTAEEEVIVNGIIGSVVLLILIGLLIYGVVVGA